MATKPLEALIVAGLLVAQPAAAQELLHQSSDRALPQPLAPELRARLADPFFRIVLDSGTELGTLDAVVAALSAGSADFRTFAVGEQMGRPEATLSGAAPDCGTVPTRRLVLAFDGRHDPSGEVLDSNVFISVFLTPAGPTGPMEVLGWDSVHGTYNYYKREGGSWRFRNSSSELDAAAPGALDDGCLACHVNGGPVMKEFAFPWNNWNSFAFEAGYLKSASAAPWSAATSPLLAGHLTSAEQLENNVAASLQRFADRTISDRITLAADGSVTVRGLRGLLDSLFLPTELNLASSSKISGFDGGGLTQPTTQSLPIPDSFFVDGAKLGDLGIAPTAFTPAGLAVRPQEYAALLERFDIDTECLPGCDTVFAWFGPETSEFDRRMVDQAIQRGVIDREFAAAVLAVDVGVPLFSEKRASLLDHVPDAVAAPDLAALPQAVRQSVLDSLNGLPAAGRSDAEEDLLALLGSPDAVAELTRRVTALRAGLQADLDPAAPLRRSETLERLYQQLVENRASFLQSPVSTHLAEFPGLFPQPTGN